MLLVTMIVDGFDTAAIGIVIPSLAATWELPAAAFTAPLVATNIAVVLGYTSSSWLTSMLGRRNVILASTALIAVGSALTAIIIDSQSVPFLTAARFVTGLGLGAVLPAAISLAAGSSPARRKESVTVAITMGLGAGVMIGGLLGGRLIAAAGPAMVFWVGAIAPALILIVQFFTVHDNTDEVRRSDQPKVRATALFAEGRASSTVLLWCFAFLVFFANYTLLSWVPTLLLSFGFDPAQAPLGTAATGIGGLVGGILLMLLSVRFGTAKILIWGSALGAGGLIAVALVTTTPTITLLLLAIVGAGLVGMVGQASIAVALYPAPLRTAGVGWAAALGRMASIVGPAVGGILLAISLSANEIILYTAIPVALASIIAALLARKLLSRPDRVSGDDA
ncbi:MFS transporter [Microbacterium sp. NIBRBAC000506063]|uniref:MFS transporter n=1 Tax=Microbacterium sp. NIBRBAC000506063 TaxID=2734618 RepID=UPI001BB7A7A5|nr:MFS transporter [Microbacterium sp. NIBRBAC000506063]QTV79108.1 MFS transporter [Microbacterium sp. NIBRBAC000506063]